jgi:hypothetical protein
MQIFLGYQSEKRSYTEIYGSLRDQSQFIKIIDQIGELLLQLKQILKQLIETKIVKFKQNVCLYF